MQRRAPNYTEHATKPSCDQLQRLAGGRSSHIDRTEYKLGTVTIRCVRHFSFIHDQDALKEIELRVITSRVSAHVTGTSAQIAAVVENPAFCKNQAWLVKAGPAQIKLNLPRSACWCCRSL